MARELRCNRQIRISPVRLIDENNEQVGIVETNEAMRRAREAGLDLVEVSPNTRPPVCRIMDYGKWKYAQRKKEQKSKAQKHTSELKEIRIRTPKIDKHDLEIKLKRAREFLERGDRVQFSLRFRGRELAHKEVGVQRFQEVQEALSDVAKVERGLRFEGRRLTVMLAPVGKQPAQKSSEGDSGKPTEAQQKQQA
ncbi:MAG: translation initiation factor IF-3 [Phycisphaerae bacterium]